MSDELDSDGLLGVDDDEELLADFDDLFSEDETGSEAGESSSEDFTDEDGLDDLDAFLDDFEKNLDVPDAEESSAAETSAAEAPASKPAVEAAALDEDSELDEILLDESGDEELDLDEIALPEEPELNLDDVGDDAPDGGEMLELEAGSDDDILDLDAGEEMLGLGGDADSGELLDLDQTELGLDVEPGEGAQADTAELEMASTDSAEAAADDLQIDDELDDDLLDLDTSGGGEAAASADSVDELPEPESAVEAQADNGEVPAEVAAVAAAATAATIATAASSTPTPSPASAAIIPPPAAGLSKGQVVGGSLVLLFSLVLSAAALWLVWGLTTQVEVLNQNMTQLQKRVVAQSRKGTISPQVQLNEQLNRLAQRVNELAVIVEGPVGHMRESYQQSLKEMNMRLAKLEEVAAEAPGSAVAAAKPRPLVTKTPTVTAKKKGAWVINLLSVASAKTADEEVARLRKMGINADKQLVEKGAKRWYRLRVTGFGSYNEAKSDIAKLEKQTGFDSAWVAKE